MSKISNQEIKMDKKTYLKTLPKFWYLLFLASVASAILLFLSIYSRSLSNIGGLLIMLGCNWYIIFNVIKGLFYQDVLDSHVNIVLAKNLNDELERQIISQKKMSRRILPYIYTIIITIIVQYGWFILELKGLGQYIMMGFVYLVITIELFRSFQIKKQVSWIRQGLDELIKMGRP